LSEVRVRSVHPLPEPLPEGEHIIWQHSPAWWPYSRRVFQVGKLGVYFLAIVAWVAGSAYVNDGEMLAVLRSLSWALPPAIGVLGVLALIAWFYARSTVYTITNRRIVIQSGLAVPSAVNLPFGKISSADLKTFGDATGDIELTMSGERLLYSMLWPNARLLRLKRPRPVLRALRQPDRVAEILGQALTADQQAAADPDRPAASDQPEQTRHTATA